MHGVAVGMQDEGHTASGLLRPVEIADDVQPGQRLDAEVLDDEPLVLEATHHASLRLEGGGLRVQPGTEQQVLSNLFAVLLPL